MLEKSLSVSATLSRAIFLDFDGVLFDTVQEAYAVSMTALGRSARIMDIDFESNHFKKFSKYRYLISTAWNYYCLIRSIDEKIAQPTIDLEKKFNKSLEQLQEEYRSLDENFFQARRHLQKVDCNTWLSLMVPYRFTDDLRSLFSEYQDRFFLVTTRDRESVERVLHLHQLKVQEGNIFARDEYAEHNSKVEIIQKLMRSREIEESIFVDDFENHLIACDSIEGLLPMQARWGYVVPDQAEDNSAKILKEIEKFIYGKNVRA